MRSLGWTDTSGEEKLRLNQCALCYNVAFVTGNRSWSPTSSWVIPGPDDGKVSVERAKVAGMNDFLVVPHSHTFIMRSPAVVAQTLRFLREGKFEHRPSGQAGG